MQYTMEELAPVVAELAQQYTAGESSSISYERAEQLMEAALYCIREGERQSGQAVAPFNDVPARQAYEAGAACVKAKTQQALALYNELAPVVGSCGNSILRSVFARDLPEFFRRYDVRFAPQDTCIILDYPVLKDLAGYTGIDVVYEFLRCIDLEQRFLQALPVLRGGRGDSMDNQAEDALTTLLGHILADKPLTEHSFTAQDACRIRQALVQTSPQAVYAKLEQALRMLAGPVGCEPQALLDYLMGAAVGCLARLQGALEHEALEGI